MKNISIFQINLLAIFIILLVPFTDFDNNKGDISLASSKDTASTKYDNNKDQMEASRLYQLASDLYEKQNYHGAIVTLQKALKIYRSIADKKGERYTLTKLGNIYQSLKNNLEALDFYRESLEISRDLNDQSGILNSLINLGGAYEKLSKYKLAIEYLNEALQLSTSVGTDVEKGSLRQFKDEMQRVLMKQRILRKEYDSQVIFWVCD